MKLPFTICDLRFEIWKKSAGSDASNRQSSIVNHKFHRAFTMVEVAISLAIIGVALVGILAALTRGLPVQRDNREYTVINQDATVFMDAIGKGAQGDNDLTNYVFLITNTVTKYLAGVPQTPSDHYGYTYEDSTFNGSLTSPLHPINSGTNIIGLLSTPEFTDLSFNPANNLLSDGYSNHIVAYVRSISGPAIEKPPQDNQILQQDSFSYRILCVNAPVATDSNSIASSSYAQELFANMHELRLTFEWPQLPNGKVGGTRQTYRATIGGQLLLTNDLGQYLYFFQPQSFNNPSGNSAPPP